MISSRKTLVEWKKNAVVDVQKCQLPACGRLPAAIVGVECKEAFESVEAAHTLHAARNELHPWPYLHVDQRVVRAAVTVAYRVSKAHRTHESGRRTEPDLVVAVVERYFTLARVADSDDAQSVVVGVAVVGQ